jgi:YD repeat-containing protein
MSEDQDGASYVSKRYAYDATGHQRAEAAYHMCGTFSLLHIFSYDGDGRPKEQLTYQFRSLGRRIYDYDDQGRLNAVHLYKNGVLQSTTQYRYDDHGRMSEQFEMTAHRTPGNKTTYAYDELGRLMREQFTSSVDPSLSATATYEYDEQGNWTRKTTRRGRQDSGSQQMEVTERVFAYY